MERLEAVAEDTERRSAEVASLPEAETLNP